MISNPCCQQCGGNRAGTLYICQDENGTIFYLCLDCLAAWDGVIV